MKKYTKIIGRRIKEMRIIKGLTQAELAECTDLSVSYISHIETGRKTTSINSLINIVNELGITVDELLYGIQENYHFEYKSELEFILEDCTKREIEILINILCSIKKLIKLENGGL